MSKSSLLLVVLVLNLAATCSAIDFRDVSALGINAWMGGTEIRVRLLARGFSVRTLPNPRPNSITVTEVFSGKAGVLSLTSAKNVGLEISSSEVTVNSLLLVKGDPKARILNSLGQPTRVVKKQAFEILVYEDQQNLDSLNVRIENGVVTNFSFSLL